MAWWNDKTYTVGLDANESFREDAANFPDLESSDRDPITPLMRRIGARNILHGFYAGTISEQRILSRSWLSTTSPLPGIRTWKREWWKWLLEETVVCPVFVPAVAEQNGRMFRFDVVAPKGGKNTPSAIARAQAETRHAQSVRTARMALKELEPDVGDNWLVFCADGGTTSTGCSGSLGLALAAWAAHMHRINNQHGAFSFLTHRYAVTGDLRPNGHVSAVDGVSKKLQALVGNRQLIVPYVSRLHEPWMTSVNRWEDAKARVAPADYACFERGDFPPCEVLMGFASGQTEPHLMVAAGFKPRRAVVLMHSDNEKESWDPAGRLKKCLEANRSGWSGQETEVLLRGPIDSKRLHLAEADIRRELEYWLAQGVDETRIVLNVTGGNKLHTLAVNNVGRGRGCPLVYLEFFGQDFTILGPDRDNQTRPTRFVPKKAGLLAGFESNSVNECTGPTAKRKSDGTGEGLPEK